jgi:hypothetical protein
MRAGVVWCGTGLLSACESVLRGHMLRFPHEHVQCKSLHAPGQPFSRFKSISDESQYRTPHELIVGAEL